MKKKISDFVPKKKKSKLHPVNIRCDSDLYKKLKDKCDKNNISIKDFFTGATLAYLEE